MKRGNACTLVTGISTGALIAPFATLGPEYDTQLKEIYTGVETSDIVRRGSALQMLFCPVSGRVVGRYRTIEKRMARLDSRLNPGF